MFPVAAPHEGTLLADSADKARNFLLDVQRRVNDAVDALGIIGDLASIAGTALTAPAAGPAFMALAVWFNQYLQAQKLELSSISQLIGVRALADLKTQSPTIAYLTSHTDDSAIPRYNVVGSIPLKNAALRIKTSLNGGSQRDFLDLVHSRDKALKAFEACRVVTYSIIGAGISRRCGFAARVLKRVDDRWGRYVNGSETINLPIVGGLTRARNIQFDGIVSKEHSQYPGLTDQTYTETAVNANHQNIYASTSGLSAVSHGMSVIGMAPPAANQTIAVSISGPTSLATGAVGTWSANVTGGTPPFTYQWSGLATGTGQTISGSEDGVLTVAVKDAVGLAGTASRTVREQIGCGTRRIC